MTQRRSVSVKDVAARAGVSFQTASKVLNGKGSASEATRARIQRAARELGYVPNRQARSLVMRRTRTIGLLAGELVDHALAELVVGAEQEARRQGYSVLIVSIDAPGQSAEEMLPALLEHRVDGILLAAPQVEDGNTGAVVQGVEVPMVTLHEIPGADVPTVGSDHVLTGYLATSHLLARGRRTIGTVTGAGRRRVAQARLRGYLVALEEAGIGFDERLVEEGDWNVAKAVAATGALLDRCPDLDAIFAQNDTMAIGVLSALRARGVEVPQDCAVAGCDDIDIAAHTAPPLTTVRIPFRETGATAMRTLLSLVASGPEVPPRVLLPVQLVERASTGV